MLQDELLEARGALITIRWFLENVKRPAAANPNPFIGAQAVYLYRKRQRAELERLHPTTRCASCQVACTST
jgi:hypothetical protein